MRKLLALFCACLMLGGCRQDYSYDTYEYTAAGAERIDILAADGDTLWFLASYPGFAGGIEYDNCALVKYDLASGEETLINSVPEGGRLLEDGRFWFYDSEEGLLSCSLEDGSERPELEKGDEDRIDVLAGAGEKLLFRRVYEQEGVDSVVGYLYDYVIRDMETGQETLMDGQTPGNHSVLGFDGETIVWSSWLEKYEVTLWKDGEAAALPDTVTVGPSLQLDGIFYWVEYDADGAVICRRNLSSGASGRTGLSLDRVWTLDTDGEKLYLRRESDGLYSYDLATGQLECVRDGLLWPENSSGFFFADENVYYALEKDGELTFVKEKLENRIITE